MTTLACGCVPLPGGGVAKKCAELTVLRALYLMAIEAHPGDMTKWANAWAAYCAHLGQEAWA